jgi:predicted nucleic acid-binding protein
MKQVKKYADSDFFLGLMKDSDWLKEKAKKIYNQNKNEIYITPFTIAELMIVCKREEIPIKKTLIQISRIAKLESISWNVFFTACDYIGKGATIFDALIMGFCGKENQIISSDNIYKKFDFDVLDLRK